MTAFIGAHAVYAVFGLMLVDAVFPAASELVMVYGGAVAAGAIAGHRVVLFGFHLHSGLPAYLAIALAGTTGYLLGSIGGWAIGFYGGPGGRPRPRPAARRMPLGRYAVLTALGSAIWAFAIAGAGWGLGSNYERFHHAFRYVDYAVAAGILVAVAYWGVRRRRSSTLARRVDPPR